MKSIKPKFFYQLSVSFLYSLTPIIVFPYVSRVLGPGNIGKINLVDYTAQFFILFASFGIPFYGVREIAKKRNDLAEIKKLTSELVLIQLIVSTFGILLFAALILFKSAVFNDKDLLVLAMINMTASAFALEWLVHGLEDFAFLSRRSFIIKLITIVFIFILVKQGADYIKYYFILVAGNMCILISDIFFALKNKIRFTKPLNPFRHLKPLSLFFLTSVSLSLYTFFDTVILGIISGTLAVGFYTTALKVIRLSHNAVNDLGGVLLPRISYLIEEKKMEEVNRVINKSLRFVLTITIPIGVYFFLASRDIILLLGGEQFFHSIINLKILSALPLIIGLSNIFFIQVLIPFGKEKKLVQSVIIGSLLSILFNVLLCPHYASAGASVACLLAEGGVCIFLLYNCISLVKFEWSLSFVASIILSCLTFIPCIEIARHISPSPFLALIISFLLSTTIYTALQYFIFSNTIAIEMVHFIQNKLIKNQKAPD